MPTATITLNLTQARIALANALANALARQKRHQRHRAKDGRPCAWCVGADAEVESARRRLAELAGG